MSKRDATADLALFTKPIVTEAQLMKNLDECRKALPYWINRAEILQALAAAYERYDHASGYHAGLQKAEAYADIQMARRRIKELEAKES